MDTNHKNRILVDLAKPFHPAQITWRPGALNGKKDKALALAYADLRAYQNRLDEVCGMDWSVSYTPWSDRIICHLTINGITRSSTGEADSDAERSAPSGGNPLGAAGTTAEAQAFKRACSMFSLGRYLYNLPTVWVEYDTANQRFTDKAQARLQGIIAQHYQRFLAGESPSETDVASEDLHVATPVPAPVRDGAEDEEPATLEQPITVEDKETENNQPSTAESQPATPIEAAQTAMDQLGAELYGNQWPQVRAHNIQRLNGDQNDNNGALTLEQIQKLIKGLQYLIEQRAPVPGSPDNPFTDAHAELNQTGRQLFTDWANAEPWLVTRWTTKNTPHQVRRAVCDLAAQEQEQLLTQLIEYAAELKKEWQKTKSEPSPAKGRATANRNVHPARFRQRNPAAPRERF